MPPKAAKNLTVDNSGENSLHTHDDATDNRSDQSAIRYFPTDLALKMIPEFSGNKSELHRFISCCNTVESMCPNPQYASLFLDIIKTKLTNLAYDVVKYKRFDNWEELKLTLQEQFLERRTIAQLQSELINSTQSPTESVQRFANRVGRLTVDLNDACIASEGIAASVTIQNLNGKLSLRTFVEGLRSPYKLVIKASRFTTFAQAVAAACEEERNNSKPLSSNHKSNPVPRSQPKCFTCGRVGHVQSQCYSTGPSLPRYPKIKQEANVNSVSVECRYCHKLGHRLEECRKRKYNNERLRNTSNLSYDPPHTSLGQPGTSQGSAKVPGNDRNLRATGSALKSGQMKAAQHH